METIAMRFSDHVAPADGTISEHKKILEKEGFVWYGKFGSRISLQTKSIIMSNDVKRVLLIHSGTYMRYWLTIEDIVFSTPDLSKVPEYYRDKADHVGVWFKVVRIDKAEKGVLKKCVVSSSGKRLTEASSRSMNPLFIIRYEGPDLDCVE